MSVPQPRSSYVIAVFALQIALLAIGITRDYRLKHEDNNALHATFARSHIELGFERTRGQNYFYSPSTNSGLFYAHHPPGPSLTLAAIYGITGLDGPMVTRTVAVFFHVLSAWLFYGLARRLLPREWDVLLATLIFVALPISAFFGRMMNHEVMVLPAALLLVRGYWECVRGGWTSARWIAAVGVGCLWAAFSGWAGFFAIGACALHAAWEATFRHNQRAPRVLGVLLVAGSVLLALDTAHLIWVLDGNLPYLRELLASRLGIESSYGGARWLGRIVELHWRYFSLTSAVALVALAYRAAAGLGADKPRDAAVEVGSIFLVAGIGYVTVFKRQRVATRLLAVHAAARERARSRPRLSMAGHDDEAEPATHSLACPPSLRQLRDHCHRVPHPRAAAHELRGLLSRDRCATTSGLALT